jgi:hypothetical protein
VVPAAHTEALARVRHGRGIDSVALLDLGLAQCLIRSRHDPPVQSACATEFDDERDDRARDQNENGRRDDERSVPADL